MTDAAHAERPEEACDAPLANPSFRCTLPFGHDGPHLMNRDIAVKWWGTKTSHVWRAPDLPAGSMVVTTPFEEA